MQKREFKYEFPFFKYYFDTAPLLFYSTVTDLAKFLGLSTSQPLSFAI